VCPSAGKNTPLWGDGQEKGKKKASTEGMTEKTLTDSNGPPREEQDSGSIKNNPHTKITFELIQQV
jgi:hypothetical protein